MIFFFLSPIYIAVNAYFIYEAFKWHDTLGFNSGIRLFIKLTWAILWSLSTLSIYAAFFLPKTINKDAHPFLYGLRRVLKAVGNYQLAITIYMGMAFVLILLSRLIEFFILRMDGFKLREAALSISTDNRRAVLGLINITAIVFITLYGVHHAADIKVNSYDITINKPAPVTGDLKAVLVADLHLGYNIGSLQMADMVKKINEESPDIVLIAGDFFDNEYEALDDPEKLIKILASIESKYGTYAVYGNHDIDERIIGGFTFNYSDPNKASSIEMDEFLKAAGIKLLMDDYITINDEIYVYGRPDYEKPGKYVDKRKTPDEITGALDKSKPIIVIDHEPRELSELAKAGVDMDLCGHTHDGQFFPMNITSRCFTWENSAGLLYKDQMANIVTSGVGLFGPNIRIGTDAEICPITIHFTNE